MNYENGRVDCEIGKIRGLLRFGRIHSACDFEGSTVGSSCSNLFLRAAKR